MPDKECRTCKWWCQIEDEGQGECQFDPPPVIWAIVDAMTAEPAAHLDYRRVAEGPFLTKATDICSAHQRAD